MALPSPESMSRRGTARATRGDFPHGQRCGTANDTVPEVSGYSPSNYPVPAFDDFSGTVPAVSERPLLTTRQVATMLGLSPATVLRRWRAGELPGYRLASNCLRFDPVELERWLEAHRSID